MDKLALPTGVDIFDKIRTNGYYYVDKTNLIKEILAQKSDVTLFTRPRRFGKTLNMTMLRSFFQMSSDKSIFDGLAIAKEKDLCAEHMGQYPVIFISLKGVAGLNFDHAKNGLWNVISTEALDWSELRKSDKLDDDEKRVLSSLRNREGDLDNSLKDLSRMLYKHYGKKVILLIDEYDVPLAKAEEYGYYQEMVIQIRNLFSAVLKTNDCLQFAVLTGCLRISKESIFTGLNNLDVYTVADNVFDEWFGFTDAEVRDMLAYYELDSYYEQTRMWYDGYRFGKVDVYCPWDVIKWVKDLHLTRNMDVIVEPQNYWANTSGNGLLVRFADIADDTTRKQLEILLTGGSVLKKLRMNMTYSDVGNDLENLWSIMLATGYLTMRGKNEAGEYELVIPNKEISTLFKEQVMEWFRKKTRTDSVGLSFFSRAIVDEDIAAMQGYLNSVMKKSISYYDGGSRRVKENFYHGMLLGMLASNSAWEVKSNREAGNGRLDLVIVPNQQWLDRYGVIFELKYAERECDLAKDAQSALAQIEEKEYADFFPCGLDIDIKKYGIAFHKKRCVVVKGS